MRVRLPLRYCPQCQTQLVPPTWWVIAATGEDVCIFCARQHRPDEVRARTPGELGLIALRALSPLN